MTETASKRRTVADVERELAEFKDAVRREALRVKEEQGWCDDGLNEALRNLGLPEKRTYRIPIDVVVRRRIYIDVDDAASEEDARVKGAERNGPDLVRYHVGHAYTYVSHEVGGPVDIDHVQEGDPDPTDGRTGGRCRQRGARRYYCSRFTGHTGQHVAGGGDYVLEVWPQTVPTRGPEFPIAG